MLTPTRCGAGRPPSPLPPDWATVGPFCGPHLRMVDPQCRDTWLTESDVPAAAVDNLVALAEETIGRQGVRLSIENSGGLGFASMGLILAMARRRLPPDQAAELGLCFDPTNPVMGGLPGDEMDELAALPADMLMIAHFKQCVDRAMIPTVAEGDVDFARYLPCPKLCWRWVVVF